MKTILCLLVLTTRCTFSQHIHHATNLPHRSDSEVPTPVKSRYSVAFLIANGTLPLDYVGAYEVFAQARMRVFTIAPVMDTVKLSSNMRIMPNYSINNAPDFDILVVPTDFDDKPEVIDWIKNLAPKIDYIVTVCGGVTPIYDAGLLDGKTITSYGPLIDHLKERAPKATVVTDKRFIDNGQVIVCGSYVSGIDGALYLLSKIYGEARTQEVANNIEYNWDREYKYVRSKLADNWLAPLYDFNPPLRGRTLRYEGDDRYWIAEYETKRDQSLKELYAQIPEMAALHHWINTSTDSSATMYVSGWTRRDFNNRSMQCVITLKQLGREENVYLLKYEIRIDL